MEGCFDADCIVVPLDDPGYDSACDVNCVGGITCRDYFDFQCMRLEHTGCCQKGPVGACCAPEGFLTFPGYRCIDVPAEYCTSEYIDGVDFTYYGDGTRCESVSCDCNRNGIRDLCDLSCGADNGACNVAGCGTRTDCDGNGLPDECIPARRLHGDVVDVNSLPDPDYLIDVSDLLCMLDDFEDVTLCDGDCDLVAADFSCVPDGVVDVSDLLCELDAFSGIFCCPCVHADCP